MRHGGRSLRGWAYAGLDLLRGLVVLSLFWAAGAGLATLLPAAGFTGSLWGMVLLFAALASGRLPEAWVARAARALLGVLGLLFVPVGVGIVAYGSLVAKNAAALAVALGLGSAATLAATGWVVRAFEARRTGGPS